MCKLDCRRRRVRGPLCSSVRPTRKRKIRVLLTRNKSTGRVPVGVGSVTTSKFSCVTLKRVRGPRVLVQSGMTCTNTLRPISEGSLNSRKCVRKRLRGKELGAGFIPFTYHSCRRVLLVLHRSSARTSLRSVLGTSLTGGKHVGVCEVIVRKAETPRLLLLPRELGSFNCMARILSRSGPSCSLRTLRGGCDKALVNSCVDCFLRGSEGTIRRGTLCCNLRTLLRADE